MFEFFAPGAAPRALGMEPASPANPVAKVRQLVTGIVFERPHVDARELVSRGAFVYDESSPSIRERLAGMSGEDLRLMARLGQVSTAGRDVHEIVALLIPVFECGKITFSDEGNPND